MVVGLAFWYQFIQKRFKYARLLHSIGDIKMAELNVKIPELLESDAEKIEEDVKELISSEAKLKRLSLFIDEVMKGAKQLS